MGRRIVSPALVAREEEIRVLESALEDAERGTPCTVFVAGEAGIGKSRLCREASGRARAHGALTLWGECLQLEGGEFPYAPVVGALRGLDPEILEAAVPPAGRSELARLLPELGCKDGGGAEESFSRHAQARLFEILLALLRNLSRHSPVLFIVEDAHWGDRSTRDFMVFLVRNLMHERVALVVTYRDDLPGDHPLLAVVAELKRRESVSELALKRLGRDDVELQVDAILGHRAKRHLVDGLYARSEGNPFSIEELLAAHVSGDAGDLTDHIHDAAMLRLEGVSAEAHAVLAVLSVIGRPAPEPLLAAVTTCGEDALSRVLRAGRDAHILVVGREDERFQFRHALMREAMLRRLLPAETRALHVAVAEALPLGGDPNAAELAFHWQAARRSREAFTARVDAGLAAERVFAFTEAREHFEEALKLAEERDVDPSACALDRVDLLRHAAEANRRAGADDDARTRIEQALLAVDPVVEPVRAAALHARLGDCFLWDDDAALESYRTALTLLAPDRTSERVRILGAVAVALVRMRRWNEALAPAREAIRLAQAFDGQVHAHEAQLGIGVALAFLGDPDAGERHVREGQRLADAHGGPEDRCRAFTYVAEVLRIRGRAEQAFDVLLVAEAEVAALGLSEAFGRTISADAADDLLRLGRWDEAAKRLDELGRFELRDDAELLHRSLSGQLAAMRGDVALAEQHLSAARKIAGGEDAALDYFVAIYAGAAELALWAGRPDEALREIEAVLTAIGPVEDPLYEPALYSLGTRAVADAMAGRPGHAASRGDRRHGAGIAERYVEQLAGLTRRHSLRLPPPEAMAHLAQCRAELARARGDAAPELWEVAADTWRELGQPYAAAYASWRLGEALRRTGRRTDAAAALDGAHETAFALGAQPLLREIDALRQRVPTARSDVLTARELDVLALIVEGCTTPQIGERLFISPHTAKRHIVHIFEKLGVESRRQAVKVASERGLVDSVYSPQ